MGEEEIRGVRPGAEVTAGVPAPRREGSVKLSHEEEVTAQGIPFAAGVACPTCGGKLLAHGEAHYTCPRHGMMEAACVRRK